MTQQDEMFQPQEQSLMREKFPQECSSDSHARFEQWRKCSPMELERVIAEMDGEKRQTVDFDIWMPNGDMD